MHAPYLTTTYHITPSPYHPILLHPIPARYREAELLHARWAMLAVPGVLLPEVLAMNGVDLGEPVWWKVGCGAARRGVSCGAPRI